MESRRAHVLTWLIIVAAAAVIIVATGQTPSRLRYEAALEHAENVVRQRQNVARERFKIGEYERFDWSQRDALIVFSTAGTPKVVADIQIVGTYSNTSKTWLWAWANESMVPAVTRDSSRVKTFGAARHLKRLTSPKWSATENDGWDMATFQAYVTGADLLYRTPSKQGKTYLTLKNIRWAAPGARYAFLPPK